MSGAVQYYDRSVGIFLSRDSKVLDLSQFHAKFKVSAADVESPNNASIRLYNVGPETITTIKEFSTVRIEAGYASQSGLIFEGEVIQYRVGKENALNSYIDILAADGDAFYSFAVTNTSVDGKLTVRDAVDQAVRDASDGALKTGALVGGSGGVLPRGKVMFGFAKDYVRNGAVTLKSSWSIEAGVVKITPLDSYNPARPIEINHETGLIGIPEQTQNGVTFKHLMNPRLQVGDTVRINNGQINQLQFRDPKAEPVAFDKWTEVIYPANVTADGTYRIFAVDHEGDTRGTDWYTYGIGLAVDLSSGTVKPYG